MAVYTSLVMLVLAAADFEWMVAEGYSCSTAENRQDCECWFCLNAAVDMFSKNYPARSDCLSSFLGGFAPDFVDKPSPPMQSRSIGRACDEHFAEAVWHYSQCMCPLLEAHFDDVAEYCSDQCTGPLMPRPEEDAVEKTIGTVLNVFGLDTVCPLKVSCALSAGPARPSSPSRHHASDAKSSVDLHLKMGVAVTDSTEGKQYTYSMEATAQTSYAQMTSAAWTVIAGIMPTLL
ncbi:unnamed protein product [Symbiodinium natans]|uniref:Folate receptor-like domain-containing protein n=1 Tax=Symbiodinium natans TaxID=878477 RepID=A0A812Q539_9DINO|nr:unnamed protein product [Symbiodinium natans]